MSCVRSKVFLVGVCALALAAAACDSSDSVSDDGSAGGGGNATTTTTTTTDATSTASGEGGSIDPSCLDVDPDATFTYVAEVSTWTGPDIPYDIEVTAPCLVTESIAAGQSLDLLLACTPLTDDKQSFDFTLAAELPPGVSLDLAAGDAVELAFAGHGSNTEFPPGSRWALRDASGLLMAAYDDAVPFLDEWTALMDEPLTASLDASACPPIACPTDVRPQCTEGTTLEREALVLEAAGEQVSVIDAQRAELPLGDAVYDVVVASASAEVRISIPRATYRFLIARKP